MRKRIRISIFILLILTFAGLCAAYMKFSLQNKVYVYVDDSNRKIIESLLEDGSIETDGDVERVVWKQLPGDWDLYIDYTDGHQRTYFLDDGDAAELKQYIIDNGTLGGHTGEAVRYSTLAVLIVILAYAVYVTVTHIADSFKKTEEDSR